MHGHVDGKLDFEYRNFTPPNPIDTTTLHTDQTHTMIIPVRCFSCGKVVGDKWETYLTYLQDDMSEGDALDKLELKRYCCRRMIVSTTEKM
jgi:DNA-directed RNA polymerase I, II, and III subunit RPABC5